GQFVVDHGEVAGQLGCDEAVGFRGVAIPQDVEQPLVGAFGPVPGWDVEQRFQIHDLPSCGDPLAGILRGAAPRLPLSESGLVQLSLPWKLRRHSVVTTVPSATAEIRLNAVVAGC